MAVTLGSSVEAQDAGKKFHQTTGFWAQLSVLAFTVFLRAYVPHAVTFVPKWVDITLAVIIFMTTGGVAAPSQDKKQPNSQPEGAST